MKIDKINDNEYIVKPNSDSKSHYYTNSYEKALYYTAFELVGDSLPYDSLESFHTSLKIALNREYTGKLGDKIDFSGQWFYPTVEYCINKQGKVKTL
jgi:hypothetical protein